MRSADGLCSCKCSLDDGGTREPDTWRQRNVSLGVLDWRMLDSIMIRRRLIVLLLSALALTVVGTSWPTPATAKDGDGGGGNGGGDGGGHSGGSDGGRGGGDNSGHGS